MIDDNLATMLEAIADANGDAAALIHGQRRRTWAELDERASLLAGHLEACGVGAGDRVAVDLYNSIEYVETVLAAMKLRAAPVNVNYRYRAQELEYVLTDASVSAVIFHEGLTETVAAVTPRLPKAVALVAVPDTDSEHGERHSRDAHAIDYDEAIAAAVPARRRQRSGDDTLIVYTGGTTGMPKGAVWRHSNLVPLVDRGYQAQDLPTPATVEELGMLSTTARHQAATVALPVPPLMHSTGMLRTFSALMVAGTVVFSTSRSFDPHEVASLIAEHRVTALTLVGDVMGKPLLACLDDARAAGTPYDLSSLRDAMSSGVRFSPDTKLGLVAHGNFTIVDVLASTEGGPFAVSETKPGDTETDVQFKLAPNARLLDDDLRDVLPGSGTVGRLAAKGNFPDGYLDDPAKSAATWFELDGERWVMPGDYATVEPDGTLQLLGRGSGVINTGGEKVFADEVQQVLWADPRITDAIVVGIDDERWGQVVAAVVSLEPGESLTEAEIAGIVGDELATYKKPRRVVIVDEVRRKATGKADLTWAAELVASRQPTS